MRFYTYHRGDCGPCFIPARAAFHHAHSRSPPGVTGPFQWRIARGALCVLLCQYVLNPRTATSQLAPPTSTCLCLRFIWLLPLGAKYSAVPRIVHVLIPNIKRAVPGYNWHNALPANAHPPHSHPHTHTPSAIPGYNWHNALPANAHPPHSHQCRRRHSRHRYYRTRQRLNTPAASGMCGCKGGLKYG